MSCKTPHASWDCRRERRGPADPMPGERPVGSRGCRREGWSAPWLRRQALEPNRAGPGVRAFLRWSSGRPQKPFESRLSPCKTEISLLSGALYRPGMSHRGTGPEEPSALPRGTPRRAELGPLWNRHPLCQVRCSDTWSCTGRCPEGPRGQKAGLRAPPPRRSDGPEAPAPCQACPSTPRWPS